MSAGERPANHYKIEEHGLILHRYWTSACRNCAIRVASEMALHVLAYNLTRVMNIIGVRPLMAARRA